jgi:hypothetical protein
MMCCGEAVLAEVLALRGQTVEVPEPEDAWTMAPSWQQQRVGTNLVMACVALPVCKKHLTVAELSPAEQAIRNGQLLEGTVTPNG